MELDPQENQVGIKRREVKLESNRSELKSREMELGSHGELDNPLLQLFLNGSFSDTVFVTLLRTAVETAVSGVAHTSCLALAGSRPT